MSEFVKAANTRDIEPGKAKLVEVKGQQIAIFNVDGKFYAIEDKCSHRGAPLSEGMLRDNTVICPWHYAEFDVTTGNKVGGCAPRSQKSYGLRVTGDVIEVEL